MKDLIDKVKDFTYLKKNDANLDAKEYFKLASERKMLK